jgi:hypothetical protein
MERIIRECADQRPLHPAPTADLDDYQNQNQPPEREHECLAWARNKC